MTFVMPPPSAAGPGPLSGSTLDRWVAGLSAADAALAILAAGIQPVDVRSAAEANDFIAWRRPGREILRQRPAAIIAQTGARVLSSTRRQATTSGVTQVRLAVLGDIVPSEVVPRLLGVPAVSSAVLPVQPPPESLALRPLQWPLRIGLLGTPTPRSAPALSVPDPAEIAGSMELIDVDAPDALPGTLDILMIHAPIAAAARRAADRGLVANAVIVFDQPSIRWPLIDAQLTLLRALTSARVTAIGRLPGRGPARARLVTVARRIVASMSFGLPIDGAVTAALRPSVIIAGELARLRSWNVPALAFDLGKNLRRSAAPARRGEPTPALEQLPSLLAELEGMSGEGSHHRGVSFAEEAGPLAFTTLHYLRADRRLFQREVADKIDWQKIVKPGLEAAVETGRATRRAREHIENTGQPRWLQCYVGSLAAARRRERTGAARPKRQILVHGQNAVDVFVGPREADALAPDTSLSNQDLSFGDEDTVRLTVVLAPAQPKGVIQRAELTVPRTGRSETVHLLIDVPANRVNVSARLILLHRNRVVQTALIEGRVGSPARLVELAAVRGDFEHLAHRHPFDVALVANHSRSGRPMVYSCSDGTTGLSTGPELDKTIEAMRTLLAQAAYLKESIRTDQARKLLVMLAIRGRELHRHLARQQERLETATRVQIVTVKSQWFLPIELAYARLAPDTDALLCPQWIENPDNCGQACGDPNDTSIVCPGAFWGISRTIERFYFEPDREHPGGTRLINSPKPSRHRLRLRRALLGASVKVAAKDVNETVAGLSVPAERARTWQKWRTELAKQPTELLVLMPHTDVQEASLEISRSIVFRGQLEAPYVTGGHDLAPVVVLFGCDTAGSAADPAGFATTFLDGDAAVVFATLTVLLNKHAAELSRRLTSMLLSQSRRTEAVGEIVTRFRRQALADGLLAGLSVTAYGDSDWTV
jgi:hypothetical protein